MDRKISVIMGLLNRKGYQLMDYEFSSPMPGKDGSMSGGVRVIVQRGEDRRTFEALTTTAINQELEQLPDKE